MKVRFAVTVVGSALGFVLPAFADEAPPAVSSTQDAVSVDSGGPIGQPAIKDHHPKRPKKQHPNPSDEASSKRAPDPSSASGGKGDPPLSDSICHQRVEQRDGAEAYFTILELLPDLQFGE